MKTKSITFNWRKVLSSILPYLAIFAFTTIILWDQLLSHATFITADRFFHFSRFYDTAMQIKTGNFNFFQTNFTFLQSGRVINALYGPFFAYLNGALLLVCRTWYRYQIISDYLLYMIAGMAMFRLCRKVKVPYFGAILLSLLYLSVGILPGWLRASNFMAWGAALAPYVMMQAINMVQDKKRPIHWVSLMLIMALVAQIHILSTLLLTAALVPFFIYALVNSLEKRKVLLDTFYAIIGTVVLSANIWGSFLLLYSKNTIATPKTFTLNYATHLHFLHSEHGNLPLFVLILIICQLLYVCLHTHQSTLNNIVTFVGLFFFVLSSKLIPWVQVGHNFPALERSFQFPYRILVVAYPLLFLGLGITLSLFSKKEWKALTYLLICCTIYEGGYSMIKTNQNYTADYNDSERVTILSTYYYNTSHRAEFWHALHSSNLGEIFTLLNRSEPDYLPVKSNKIPWRTVNKIYEQEIINPSILYTHKVKNGKLNLYWQVNSKQTVTLPIVMYKQSLLTVNGHKVNPKTSLIGAPSITQKKGSNHAILSFAVPSWFNVLLGISILSWIAFGLFGIYRWLTLSKQKS